MLISGCTQTKINTQDKEGDSKMPTKKILMIIAPTNFRDEELLEPKQIFEKSNFEIKIASKGVKQANGMLGAKIDVDLDIKDINVKEYEAVIFVGGSGATLYFNDQKVLSIAKDSYESNKITAAICIAPSILANAGILKGKKATSFPTEKTNLQGKGAIYTTNNVEIDGKIVTADGPASAKKFAEAIKSLL